MNTYWFRKRRGLMSKDLGWGWIPISWEGWLTVVVAVGCIVASGFVIGVYSDDATLTQGFVFVVSIVCVAGLGAVISHLKTKP